MSDYIVEKTLVVAGITVLTELATGDVLYQIMFVEYIDNTDDVLRRIPPSVRENFLGNKIAANNVIIFLKTEEVPYKVGSKWNLKINQDGTTNLVKAQ